MNYEELIQKWEQRSLEAKAKGQIEYYKACLDFVYDLRNNPELDCENNSDEDEGEEEFEFSESDQFMVNPILTSYYNDSAQLTEEFPSKELVRKHPDFFNRNHPDVKKILLEIAGE